MTIARLLDDRRAPLLLALLIFATALGVSAGTGRFSTPDRWEYSEIASHVLAGEGMFHDYMGTRYYFYGPPLYPLLLAAVIGVTGSESVVLYIQAALCAATSLIVYDIARNIWNPRVALLAAVLAGLHPGNLIYAGRLHSQILDVFFIVLAFSLWVRVDARATRSRAIWTGAVLGLAMLSRGTMGPVVVGWLAAFVWQHRAAWRQAGAVAAAASIGVAVLLLPVFIRGYQLYGELVPLRSDTGANLWYGNHRGASGTSHTNDPVPLPITAHLGVDDQRALAGKNEIQQYRHFMAKVRRFIVDEPQEAASLFGRKLLYFWSASPHTGHSYPRAWTLAYLAYYTLIALLSLIGLARALRGSTTARNAARAFLIMAALASLTQAAFYVEGRHRWQLEPLLLMFSALSMASLFASLTRRRG